MNEQQMADLFSAQLDQLLAGQAASELGPEGADLAELINLSQHFTRFDFQATPAAHMAFQGQLNGWFGSAAGTPAAIVGGPKMFVTLIAFVIIVGVGYLFLTDRFSSKDNPPPALQQQLTLTETISPAEAPEIKETNEPAPLPILTVKPQATTSLGDVVGPLVTSSLGDTLSPPTQVTMPEPAATLTGTVAVVQPDATPSAGEGDSDENDLSGDSDDTASADEATGDHDDRGHGNDSSGYDPDNPGQSSGVSGGQDNNGNKKDDKDKGGKRNK